MLSGRGPMPYALCPITCITCISHTIIDTIIHHIHHIHHIPTNDAYYYVTSISAILELSKITYHMYHNNRHNYTD
jgi:hypothetical protein